VSVCCVCSPTAGCRGVGIRFVPDNASGSSQEIHGRGAEINVLSHLHTSRPHDPHILPAVFSPPLKIVSALVCFLPLSRLLAFYLPSVSPFFPWARASCRSSNRRSEYRTNVYAYTRPEVNSIMSADKCDVQSNVPVVICTFHKGDYLSRQNLLIFHIGKVVSYESLIFWKCRSYIRWNGVNKNLSYENER